MNKRFTRFTLALLLVVQGVSLFAQAVTTPRALSPAAMVGQTVGISTVTVTYSRPSVKGRDIWGAQVPYGYTVIPFGTANPAPWRAGANENTVITFSHPAKVEGRGVPAGSYGLFFAVNKDNSAELVLSKDYKAWGNFFYEPSHDLMRVKIQTAEVPMTEMLTYEFVNNTRTTTELHLRWEKKLFPVKMEFAVDDIVIANAEAELQGAIGFNFQSYLTAVNYAMQNNVALDKSLVWVDKAVAINKSFATLNAKAGVLRKMGKNEEADKLKEEAVAIGNENDLNVYGYQLLNQNQFDKGIEVLTLVTQRYPKSANAWDSLGEAYYLKGDKKNAKVYFTKSLTLNPPEATKANSEKYLKMIAEK